MGRRGPADQLDARISLLLAFLVRLPGIFLHLLEQIRVVDLLRILVFDVAFLFVGDNHSPRVRDERAGIGRHEQAERIGHRRITPQFHQDGLRVPSVEELDAIGDFQGGQAIFQDDFASLKFQARDQRLCLFLIFRAILTVTRNDRERDCGKDEGNKRGKLHSRKIGERDSLGNDNPADGSGTPKVKTLHREFGTAASSLVIPSAVEGPRHKSSDARRVPRLALGMTVAAVRRLNPAPSPTTKIAFQDFSTVLSA